MIEIKNLILNFGRNYHMDIEYLNIIDREIFSIIGPNGAGKTTLLNILSLFEKPEKGKVVIFGKDIFKIKDILSYRRKISYVFSNPYLLDDTVQNNVNVPLRLRGKNNEIMVNKMLRLFKIENLKYRNALKLSQGQMHRVSLARAFVFNPEIIFLDEPFLSLDRAYKEELMTELRNVIKEMGITALFVSQDQHEALRLADRIAVKKEGRILETGRSEQIFTKPAVKETADFVGIETVAEGIIYKKQDNLCSVKVKNKTIEVVSLYEINERVFVLIRPEDVIVSKYKEKTSARNSFKAKITGIEPYGLEYKISLNCGFNILAFITKQSVGSLSLKKGKEVYISFKATAAHLIKR